MKAMFLAAALGGGVLGVIYWLRQPQREVSQAWLVDAARREWR